MIFVIELDTILFCKLRMKKKKDKIYTTVEFGQVSLHGRMQRLNVRKEKMP